MLAFVLATSTAIGANGDFTTYYSPGRHKSGAAVETVVDRGPISEIIVRCGRGTAILSFSKVEKRYCTPKSGCFGTLSGAVSATCGG